jgi:hypothetical protein
MGCETALLSDPCALKQANVYSVSVGSSGKPTVVVTVVRRCLACDFIEQKSEPDSEDPIGPPCTRCHAPTERVEVLARRSVPHEPNPHAAALGRLGGLKGGPARAAALPARRRREIARAAAQARWRRRPD